MEEEQRRGASSRERRVRQQGPAYAHDGAEWAQSMGRVRALGCELRFPPRERGLGGDSAALREAEEVNAVRRPRAVGSEMRKDPGEKLERGCGVRLLEEFAEWVEGCVPLERLFVEERDPRYQNDVRRTISSDGIAGLGVCLPFRCTEGECSGLRQLQLTTELAKWNLGIAYAPRQVSVVRGSVECGMRTEAVQENEQILVCPIITGVVRKRYRNGGCLGPRLRLWVAI